MSDIKEKLVELISKTPVKTGFANSTFGKSFQPILVEVLANYLIANGVTIQEWIGVEERLPEPGTPCLGYTGSGCEVALYEGDDKWWTTYHNYSITSKRLFTHWMPLPEPPKGE